MHANPDNKETENLVSLITAGLQSSGISTGDVLMVHASYKALGPDKHDLSPEIIIQGLLKAIGDEGTMMMPALSYLQEPHDVHSTLETPSNVGALPEYFRTRAGSMRSVHPTHSVSAIGARAEEMIEGHADDSTPCGSNSPFHKILNMDAKILMLGCGLKPNTAMHALEEIAGAPYLFSGDCAYRITDASGKTYNKVYQKHGFQNWYQRYDRVDALGVSGLVTSGKVLEADVQIIDTRLLQQAVLDKMKTDILYFVDKKE